MCESFSDKQSQSSHQGLEWCYCVLPLARADSPGGNVGAAGGERRRNIGRNAQPISHSLSIITCTKKTYWDKPPPWFFHTPLFHLSLLQPPPLSHTHMQKHTNDILQQGSRLCQYLGKGDGWHGNNRLTVHLLLPPTRMVPDKLAASQKALGDLESQLHVFSHLPLLIGINARVIMEQEGGVNIWRALDDKADINHLFVTH